MNHCYDYCKRIHETLREVIESGRDCDGNHCSTWDYINEEVLDVEYTIDRDEHLLGVTLYVTVGGPTCYIDTRRGEIVTLWGTDSARLGIDPGWCDIMTEYFRY